jgi:hypothetical protein
MCGASPNPTTYVWPANSTGLFIQTERVWVFTSLTGRASRSIQGPHHPFHLVSAATQDCGSCLPRFGANMVFLPSSINDPSLSAIEAIAGGIGGGGGGKGGGAGARRFPDVHSGLFGPGT